VRDARPSITARGVALARSELSRPATPEGDPAAEQRLYATLRPSVWLPRTAGRRRRMAARTRFFDDEVLGALDAGVAQVVIVGAGYDGRALRFRSPGVAFFELDHPATQRDKRRRVEALGVPLDAVTFTPIDLLRDRIRDVLASAGQRDDEPSVFLCEGLLGYLTPPVVEHLLGDLRARAAPGSRLAVSAREDEPAAGGPATRSWVSARRLMLRVIGEPRRCTFAPGEFGALLDRTGWRPVRQVARDAEPQARRRRMLVAAEPV